MAALGVFLSAFLLAATLLVGFISRWTEDEDREWWARGGAWMLLVGIVWLVMSSLVIFGPLLLSGKVANWLLASVGGVSGLITVAGGWSARSAAKPASAATTGLAARLGRLTLPLAAAIFAAVLLLAVSWLTSGLLGRLQDLTVARSQGAFPPQWPFVQTDPSGHVRVLLAAPAWLVLAVGAGLALLGGAVALLVNTNQFSLHAMYRARLIRAYLGASNVERRRNPFTGFDETDNIAMHELWPSSPPASPPAVPPPGKPGRKALFHVVNMALNLVHGDRLAWQDRKAHSFTVTPLHAGSMAVGDAGGYRRTRSKPDVRRSRYGGSDGISLGTAITISGAAASPNMGYHSSPLVTFLMTFFNARLGWWLGNPGPAGNDTFYLSSPRFTVRPIVAEAFGLTGRTAPYVYLSDGGHFDNLGLYEMVLRRCHLIVVSDGSCDARLRPQRSRRRHPEDPRRSRDFHRVPGRDLDLPALGRSRDARPRPLLGGGPHPLLRRRSARAGGLTPPAPWRTAMPATAGSSTSKRPTTEPSRPMSHEYARANDEFPHESTVDQFFSESQFESYRMLGVHAIARLGGAGPARSLDELVRHAAAGDCAIRASSVGSSVLDARTRVQLRGGARHARGLPSRGAVRGHVWPRSWTRLARSGSRFSDGEALARPMPDACALRALDDPAQRLEMRKRDAKRGGVKVWPTSPR